MLFARSTQASCNETMAHLHDTGYKLLFSHADLVRELLEVFAPPGVAELLNYKLNHKLPDLPELDVDEVLK